MTFFLRNRVKSGNFYVDTDFSVIHEDDDLLVLDKPAPLAVYAVGSYSELNLHTLAKKDPRWSDCSLRFVHRLDAETSGVIVAAKNERAARAIGIDFLHGRVQKTYRALVFGVPAESSGLIDLPLGNDSSSGFQTVRVVDHEKGQPSQTRYRVLSEHPAPGSGRTGGYARLELQPLTGRTHQLRAHLSFIGHPIVGDKIYVDLKIFEQYVVNGLDETMLQRLKLPRLALHAHTIQFTHPATRQIVRFESPEPDFIARMHA